MQECTVQSHEEDSGAVASGWGLLMLRRVVDIDLTSAPEKKEFLFFRVYTDASVSCHVSASGSLNVTGPGERRCLLRASLERNLTEKSHKTSFKEQAEIACLSSSASLSHRHPPPHPLSYGTLSCLIHIRWRHTGWEWQHLRANLLRGSMDVYIWRTVSGREGWGGLSQDTSGSAPSSP